MPEAYFVSPVGMLKLTADDEALRAIDFLKDGSYAHPGSSHPALKESVVLKENAVLKEAVRQLDEYFKGKRESFDLKLKPEGTEFQKRVWMELLKIPFGRTISYLELAERLGDRKVIRAVAGANGRNRIPIIIPCHRVIGSDGSLTGYSGGLDIKKWLLRHEGSLMDLAL
ncbi:MAG: methylated-DNA--[protein]-cysteine S-methyltransferase [Ignavibacteria bacterium]|jgi:methylated-DNA-[protein]-cysteine S-methyltransferase|nr:methylated-DNA--[protein]-cysteine S-methyltransferase [Ignavibacteria bacterium]MCU7502011.1 methylated-DNA--[protein]-cysteine S-methyltransferase [Ignavibacteria bacterium]MCU7516979.1 methylated-DNA--[protein]-cysteine S-methyltransferase [Ignavibacteria bacterium]